MYSCSVVAMTIGGVGDAPILLKIGLQKMVRIIKVMDYRRGLRQIGGQKELFMAEVVGIYIK